MILIFAIAVSIFITSVVVLTAIALHRLGVLTKDSGPFSR
jgi:hypothetical protein